MSRRDPAAILFGLMLVGCSGDGATIPPTSDARADAQVQTATATGMVLQKPVHIASAYAYYRGLQEAYLPGMQQPPDGFAGVTLLLDTAVDTCSSRFPATKNATNLIVNMLGRNGPTTPVALGDYTVANEGPSGNMQGCIFMCSLLGLGQADALFATTDDMCVAQAPGPTNWATGGTITVKASDAQHIAGEFHITFTTGDVTGTFDAPVCTGAEMTSFSPQCH